MTVNRTMTALVGAKGRCDYTVLLSKSFAELFIYTLGTLNTHLIERERQTHTHRVANENVKKSRTYRHDVTHGKSKRRQLV